MTQIVTYTLTNTNATKTIDILRFEFTDDSNITHTADLSNFNLSSSYGGNNTLQTVSRTYNTGGYLRKHLTNDSRDRTVYYSTHTGSTLTIQNSPFNLFDYPDGVQAGWIVTGQPSSPYNGLSVVSVTDNRHAVLSGPPSSTPNEGASITFSSSTFTLILDNTTTLAAGWTITGNGYTPPPSGAVATIIEVIDSTHIKVSRLSDTPPSYGSGSGSYITFTAPTKFLVLNAPGTLGISAGWTAAGEGYNGESVSQVVDGSTLIMSGDPGSFPSSGGTITFTDTAPIKTLAPFEFATFTMDYTTPTHTIGANYPGTVTIHAKEGSSNLVKGANNYVNIYAVPPTSPSQVPTPPGGVIYSGHGNHPTFTVQTFTTLDNTYGIQTVTVVTNDQTGQSYTVTGIASNPAGDPSGAIAAAISTGNDPASQAQTAQNTALAAPAPAAPTGKTGDGDGDGDGG